MTEHNCSKTYIKRKKVNIMKNVLAAVKTCNNWRQKLKPGAPYGVHFIVMHKPGSPPPVTGAPKRKAFHKQGYFLALVITILSVAETKLGRVEWADRPPRAR